MAYLKSKAKLLGVLKLRRKRHRDIDAYTQLIWGSLSLLEFRLTANQLSYAEWFGKSNGWIQITRGIKTEAIYVRHRLPQGRR